MLPEDFSRMIDYQGSDGEGLDYKDSVVEVTDDANISVLTVSHTWTCHQPLNSESE